MATTTADSLGGSVEHPGHHVVHTPAEQAYWLLYVGFIIAPIIAGADKFLGVLGAGDWTKYLTPLVPRITGIAPHTFMQIVGVIEIVAGVAVALKPKYFAYVVAAWLLGIIINLLLIPGLPYLDIALRDLGLLLGALALSRLAMDFDHRF